MAATGIAVSVSMGVMKPVLEKLSTLMGDEYKKIKGLRKKVAFLQLELRDMDALLEMMDCADELDPRAKKWRRDIIEMSYNIEDCIDDFMHSVGEADNKMGILEKAANYLRTFMDRRRLANDFQEIKTQLKEASERRKRYMLDQCISVTSPVVVDPRLPALYKESASLVGMKSQKDELVSWAMDEVKQLKFMAIVGFGGIGKTTLASEVYREVGGKFEYKAFISVSQKPQMIVLFNSLLSELGLQTYSHACQLQDPINKIREHLEDKRYFIVVDDLWEMEAWDAIQCAFPHNNSRSRLMITTRDDKVAKRCCGTSGIIHNMKPLSESDSRKLFFTRIFGSEDDCPSGFEEVSCAILKRCGGLPLAIITVAGILASQQTKLKEAWEYIQTALAPELESNIDYEKMMYILDLSYMHLPRHLKACFLYLGTYPEDHTIKRVELVRRWVAEGFVSNCGGLNVWDVAERYFNELVNRSMIQPLYWGYEESMSDCRVHDMMLDLILRKCKQDNFLILVNNPHDVAAGQDRVIRRLTVDLKGLEYSRMAKTSVGNLSHLRSLTILTGQSNWWIPLLPEFKFVRVLHLWFGWIETKIEMDLFFKNINQLCHLRYLMVGGHSITLTQLTTPIKGLRLLETLDLSQLLVPSDRIAFEFVDLPRLSHLCVPVVSGTGLPRGIDGMKQLRTLRGFHVGHSSLESIIDLGKLTALSELYLVWSGPKEPIWMSALRTSLEKLDMLRSFEVTCGVFGKVALCADALSLLSPPFAGRLERLCLTDWSFSIVPRWIGHLCSLKVLLLGAKRIIQEDIAMIGMLPSLIGLRLRIVHVPVTRIVIGEGLFTLLKWFSFDCDGISSLTFEAGAMRNLGHLALTINIDDWDRATPQGLQHLQGLQRTNVCYRARCISDDGREEEADAALIKSVFQDTVPVFTIPKPYFTRLEECDQLEEDPCIQGIHNT